MHCVASRAVLVERIERRNAERRDPSEATVEVLDAQLTHYETPMESEAMVLTLDTSAAIDATSVANRILGLIQP